MNRKILRSKNGSIITPYSKSDNKPLEYSTSDYDHVYHRRIEETGFIISNYNNQSAFISHKHDLKFLIPQNELESDIEIKDIPIVRSKRMSDPYELDEDIVLSSLQGDIADRVLKSIEKNTRDFYIQLQTGRGKTLLTIYLMSMISTKTLVTCFSNEILSQWIKTFNEKTTKNIETILQINSSKILEDIIANPDIYGSYDVFICTTTLITSYLKKTDYNRLEIILNNLGIGLWVVDEAHMHMGAITKINAVSNILYTIYLSAEFGLGQPAREEKFLRLFKNIKLLTPPDELVKSMKYTKAIIAEYNSKPNMGESMGIFNAYGFDPDAYMDYQIKKNIPQRLLDRILPYISKAISNSTMNYRTLILLTKIAHVDIVAKYIQENYPQYKTGPFHSKIDPVIKNDVMDNSDIIVSTYDSFSTGVDTYDIKFVIGFNQSNKIEDSQSAGRARPLADGTDAIYFMLIDNGFPYCKRKLNSRLKYIKKNKIRSIYNIYLNI